MMTDLMDREKEAECAVCGSMLLDGSCIREVTKYITADDFAIRQNADIFRAAVRLVDQHKPVDMVTITRELGDSVSLDYLRDLLIITPTAANAAEYAKQVREASMRRGLLEVADYLREASVSPKEAIGEVMSRLEAIEAQDTARDLSTSSDAMHAFFDHRRRVESGGGYVRTFIRDLDDMLGGGLLNGGLYVLAARPGVGKTAMGLVIAENVAEKVGPVLYISLELDAEQLAARRLSRLAKIPYDVLMMGTPSERDYERILDLSVTLADRPWNSNKWTYATVEDIAALARKVKGLRLVVVDYFGLIRPKNSGKATRYEYTTENSGELKSLARQLNVPILCLSQLNRENQKRADKRPTPADLRDTGALEQDADAVILLHSDDDFDAGPGEATPLDVIIGKNRHSHTGKCEMAFYKETGTIVPWAR